MGDFWHFARRMLRHRRLVAAAITMALLSAAGLGVGILGLVPILRNILGNRQNLPEMAAAANGWLAKVGVQIPAAWIDALPTSAYSAVLWVVIGLGVLAVFGAVFNFLHAYFALTVIARTIAGVRRETFRRVLHLPLGTVVSRGPSDMVSRIVYDTASLAHGFNSLLSRAVGQASKGLATLIAAFVIDWRLALIASFVGPVLAVIIRKLGKRIRRASRSALQEQSGLYLAASEAVGGLRVLKVHTTERMESGRFHRINKRAVRQELRVRTARALASPLVELLALFVLGALSVVAAKAIFDGLLTAERFLATLTALGIAGASLKPITGLINDMQQSSAAAARLRELLSLEAEPGHDRKLPSLPTHSATIELRDVSYTYPGAEEPALRSVNLTINHGQTVAIVGPNGSGKTTLLSLIPRLFDPDEGGGAVFIDGRDLREVSVRSVRRQIGVVTQEVVLFRGTIASNIAYGREWADREQVRRAAQRARAEEFILAKPGGYDEPIGEDGAGLSGGQRQRLAIARAILRDPSILLLDEATSMIDADSEAKIAEALSEFSRGRTCLIVAHRLSTVVNADRIVVMDHGRVIDDGRHEELLKRCATYRLIAQNQLFRAPDALGIRH